MGGEKAYEIGTFD